MTPNLLAVDTSTHRAAVALATARGTFAAETDPTSRHGRSLVPVIRDLLVQAGFAFDELDGFVAGLGPGSYTGLRVGLMALKTFAYASGKGLAGFDSLELIARNAPPEARRVSVISDAQRGEVYAADFTRDSDGGPLVPTGPTRAVLFETWAADLPAGTLVLGPAALQGRHAGSLPPTARAPADPSSHEADPNRLAELAVEVWESGRREDVFFVEPVYLRRSAAEEQWDKLGR